MKKSLILGVIFLSLFAGCSDSGSSEKSDSDPILTDVDQDEPSAVDGDNASSESPEEKSDADPYGGAEECPDLKDAKFPYERTDGKIHFCRRCDTIADDDPQCIRNLWKENSESFKRTFLIWSARNTRARWITFLRKRITSMPCPISEIAMRVFFPRGTRTPSPFQ